MTALDKMQSAIAYTVIDKGTKPFGDQAIKGMFGDLNALGSLYQATNASDYLSSDGAKQGLTEIAVQFAADVAGRAGTDDILGAGAITFSHSHNLLVVDLDPDRWVSTSALSDFDIVGRDTILNDLATTADVPLEKWQAEFSDITRIFAGTGSSGSILDAENTPKNADGKLGAAVLIGGDGADKLRGGDGNDLLIGGKGADLLRGGSGNNILIGGEGNDTLIAEGTANSENHSGDTLIGGAGADRFVLGAMSDVNPLYFTIEDASAEDRLLVPYHFFDGSQGDFDGSPLIPILGGMLDAGETFTESGYATFQFQHQQPYYGPTGREDTVHGVYTFAGWIDFTMQGSDLLISLKEGKIKNESYTAQDYWYPDQKSITSAEFDEATTTYRLWKNAGDRRSQSRGPCQRTRCYARPFRLWQNVCPSDRRRPFAADARADCEHVCTNGLRLSGAAPVAVGECAGQRRFCDEGARHRTY